MIFHSNFAIFAFLLLVAFSVNLGGVKADVEYECEITLEFATWEDASLPKEDILVPDMNLLKYGIPHVLTERFDILAGAGNWMTDQTFQSYQLREARDEEYDEYDYDENDFHRQLRRKKKKIKKKKKKKKELETKPLNEPLNEPESETESEPESDGDGDEEEEEETDPEGDDPDGKKPKIKEQYTVSAIDYKCQGDPKCYEFWGPRLNRAPDVEVTIWDDDDDDLFRLRRLDESAFEDELFESHRELRNKFTHDDDRPFPGTMPYSCWRSHKCKSEYMKKSINRNRNKGRIRIGMCNLCDDDTTLYSDPAKQKAYEQARARINARRKKKKNGKRMLLTVDQLVGGIEEYHPDVGGSIDTHMSFEEDVCAELSNLRGDFDSLKTIEDCKIRLHCQAYVEEDFEDEDEFTIVDNRYVEEGETNEGNRGLLSSIIDWSMHSDGDEEGGNLYSITAVADL